MINGLFIFSQRGEVLISRLFKDGVKRNISDVFRIQVISNLDVSAQMPCVAMAYTNVMMTAPVTRADTRVDIVPPHQAQQLVAGGSDAVQHGCLCHIRVLVLFPTITDTIPWHVG